MQFEEVIVGQINDPEQFRSEHAWRSDVKYQLQFLQFLDWMLESTSLFYVNNNKNTQKTINTTTTTVTAVKTKTTTVQLFYAWPVELY